MSAQLDEYNLNIDKQGYKPLVLEKQTHLRLVPLYEELVASVFPYGKFKGEGKLVIAGVTTPKQDFVGTRTDSKIVIESVSYGNVPKFVAEFCAEPETNKLLATNCFVTRSVDTVDADILFTRYVLAIDESLDFAIRYEGKEYKFKVESLALDQKETLLDQAAICRKLRYIEQQFDCKFKFPSTGFSHADVHYIDLAFRAITQGEFSVRSTNMVLLKMPPGSLDLSKPPFSEPGPYEFCFRENRACKILILGKVIQLGTVLIRLNRAALLDSGILNKLKGNWNQPEDIMLAVLDCEIFYCFDRYLPKSDKAKRRLQVGLDRFRDKLAEDELPGLAELVERNLIKDISSSEACRIVMNWLASEFPNYLIPAEAGVSLDESAWRVDIWTTNTQKNKGIKKIGEALVNKQSGKILEHTDSNLLDAAALEIKKLHDQQIMEMNEIAVRWAEEQKWLKEHRKEYAGQWVALEGSNLISHSANAKEVFDAARLSAHQPLIVQVESLDELPFSGW
jgi:hypothetical protein